MQTRKHYVLPRHYEAVGEYLKELREEAGLTQREVSLALDYSSAQFISNFERGISLPPLKKMKGLQKLYRMNIDKLICLILDSERTFMLGTLVGRKKVSIDSTIQNRRRKLPPISEKSYQE